MEKQEMSGNFTSSSVRRKIYQEKHEEEKQAIKDIDKMVADANTRRKRYKEDCEKMQNGHQR